MSSEKKYFEAVFEGKYDTISGMMEGFLLGADKNWKWFFSRDFHIEAETFTDAFLEWASLKSKLHHIIVEEDFLNALSDACKKHPEMKHISDKYIKSTKEITKASFEFESKTYAKKYGLEIQEILRERSPKLEISDFKEEEKENKDAEGIELYTPAHDYDYESEGKISGPVDEVIEFRTKLNLHPLVEVSNTKLYFK